MSRDQRSQSVKNQELKCELKSPSDLSIIGVKKARQFNPFKNINLDDSGVIDLTVGDEIVVQPPFTPGPLDQAVSSELPVNNLPESIALRLKTWYCNVDGLIPPPCAVGPGLAQRIERFRPGLPVFFSYKGVEEMSVMAYELDGFEGNIKRFIIVAEGPTKGPFIIQCRQPNNRKSLPLSYHIWEGVNGTLKGFEPEPSILQLRRTKKNDHRDAQNVTEGSAQLITYVRTSGRVLAEKVPCAKPQSLVDQGTHSDQEIMVDELEICQDVLTELMDAKYLHLNQPFLEPVDPVALSIPNYFRIIQQPMDLSTIEKKLVTCQYRTSEDFKNDLGLMFNNCSTFNEESDSVYQNGLQLNELFVELWAQRKCPVQDDSFLREVSVQPISGDTESALPPHAWPTIEPFTPPTTSAASPTQGYDKEEDQPLAPATAATQRPQTHKTPAPEQAFPQQDSRRTVISLELCQKSIAPCETPRPRNYLNRRNSDPLGASSDGKDEHQIADQCSQRRPESPVHSDSDWETLRSSRETTYSSEMDVEAEREFFRSEYGEHRARVAVDDNAQRNSEPGCEIRRKSMSQSMDGLPEDTSVKRIRTAHRPQTLPEPQIQASSEETLLELSNEGAFITSLGNQYVPSREVYSYHREVFESTSSVDASGLSDYKMESLRTDQIFSKTPASTDNVQHMGFPQIQQNTICPVELNQIQAILDPFSERSEEPSESEYVESAGRSDKPTEQYLSPLDCSYANLTSDSLLQPDDSPHREHEEANPELPHITTEKEDLDIDDSAGEISDQEYSARDYSEGDAFEPDQDDSGSEASDQAKQKMPLKKLQALTTFTNRRYSKHMRPRARAKLSEVVNGKRKCGLCKKFKSLKYTKCLSSKTDCYICKTCKAKERLEEDYVDMKERCVDCKIHRRELDLRSTNADCDYVCDECQRGRDSRDGQPLPKRARVTHPADRRCDDCGGDRKKSNWRRNPDQDGGYICQTCATYLRRTKVHRQLNETRMTSVEKAREETPNQPHTDSNMVSVCCIQQQQQTALPPDQQENLDMSITTPEPLKKEIVEDDDVVEIPPPTLIGSTRLRQHMRDNVVFLFYTPSGQKSDAKTFRDCDSVYKLFGQALGAKVYGLADEKKQPAGNVLEICFGAGQAGAIGSDLRLVQEDGQRFGKLVEAIERKGWWGERSGGGKGGGMVVVGSGILEVRAVV